MRYSREGFSLVEVICTVGILAVVLVGLLELFIYTSALAEMSGNLTVALNAAQGKMEEIRNHSFSLITTDYASGGSPGNTFDVSQPTGKGVIYVDSSNSDLLKIKIVVSWRNKKNRIIGEDINLNGSLDAGEDLDGNGQLDSLASIESLIAKK